MLLRRSFLAGAALLISAAGASAGGISPQAAPIVRALEQRYHRARTLKATFLERFSDARQSAQVESGTVYFGQPARMRWEYESPENKLFLSDGKTVWFYVPADHTVTRTPVKQSADWRTPLALLTGDVKLSQLCDQVDLAERSPAEPGRVVLRCLPRGEKRAAREAAKQNSGVAAIAGLSQPFDQVLIEVSPTTGELGDVRVLQPGGVEIEYRFGNWDENPFAPESLFHFQAPAGVAIVDGSQDLQSLP